MNVPSVSLYQVCMMLRALKLLIAAKDIGLHLRTYLDILNSDEKFNVAVLELTQAFEELMRESDEVTAMMYQLSAPLPILYTFSAISSDHLRLMVKDLENCRGMLNCINADYYIAVRSLFNMALRLKGE